MPLFDTFKEKVQLRGASCQTIHLYSMFVFLLRLFQQMEALRISFEQKEHVFPRHEEMNYRIEQQRSFTVYMIMDDGLALVAMMNLMMDK
jgi:hypothetical protein